PLALIFMYLGLLSAHAAIEAKPGKRRRTYALGFPVMMTLMVLTKESFLVLLPALVLYDLYLKAEENEGFFKNLFRNIGTVVYEAVLFLACMAVIVFYSGTSSTGYAGVDESYKALDYLKGMWMICKGELSVYLVVFLLVFLVQIVLSVLYLKGKVSFSDAPKLFVKKRLYELAITVYAAAFQILLHAKSGMSERYLIPTITWLLIYVFCFAFPLWSELLRNLAAGGAVETEKEDIEEGKRADKKTSAGKRAFPHLVCALLSCIWLIFMVATTNVHATCLNYVYVCSNNTLMLLRLNELAQANGGEDCKIIVCADYGEWNLAISAFMEELYGVPEVYSLSKHDPYNDISEDRYLIEGEGERTLTIPEADIYVTQSEFLTIKMQDHKIDHSKMQQETFANYIVFSR
nr:hypothetical protein [Lachnospiraceae bacterium]